MSPRTPDQFPARGTSSPYAGRTGQPSGGLAGTSPTFMIPDDAWTDDFAAAMREPSRQHERAAIRGQVAAGCALAFVVVAAVTMAGILGWRVLTTAVAGLP